jgi:hypothetical protein
MMGQQRQKRRTYNIEEDLEMDERRGAGYVEESKRDTYLPDSIHASRRHMSALAKSLPLPDEWHNTVRVDPYPFSGPICPSTACQGAETLSIHIIWMWNALSMGV